MKKLYLAFLCCLVCGRAMAVERPFLKVDCFPELKIFEVRLFRFEQTPNGENFLDKAGFVGGPEYELLKEKYALIHEYEFMRDVPRSEKDNFMVKECVIGEAKYTIRIDHWGTHISKGDVDLAKGIFFESAWNDWALWQLIYNAERQEFLLSGATMDGLELRFSFSSKEGSVLDEDVIKGKIRTVDKNSGYKKSVAPLLINFDD